MEPLRKASLPGLGAAHLKAIGGADLNRRRVHHLHPLKEPSPTVSPSVATTDATTKGAAPPVSVSNLTQIKVEAITQTSDPSKVKALEGLVATEPFSGNPLLHRSSIVQGLPSLLKQQQQKPKIPLGGGGGSGAGSTDDSKLNALHHTVRELRTQNTKLQQRIIQLESQLAEYKHGKPSDAQDFQAISKSAARDLSFDPEKGTPIDLSIIDRNIQVLNKITPNDNVTASTSSTQNVHSLKPIGPIVLGFYRNGLCVEDSNDSKQPEFLPYSSARGQALVADLLHGFLPSELQTRYPNGAKLQLKDCSSEHGHPTTSSSQPSGTKRLPPRPHSSSPTPCSESKSEQPMQPSSGRRLGSGPSSCPGSRQEDRHPSHPLLARLASSKDITPSAPLQPAVSLPPSDSSVRPDSNETVLTIDLATPASPHPTCVVKVRTPAPWPTLVVTLNTTEVVLKLKKCVAERLKIPLESFELCSGMGRTILSASTTMAEAGLVPNGTVFYRKNGEPALSG